MRREEAITVVSGHCGFNAHAALVSKTSARGGCAFALRSSRAWLPLLALVGALLTDVGLSAAPPAPTPIFAAAEQSPKATAVSAAGTPHRRVVTVDVAALSAIRFAGGGSVTLNLNGDTAFSATVERVATYADAYSLFGRLDGYRDGRFNLVVHGEAVAGTVRDSSNGTYRIRYLDEGTHLVEQLDTASFPPCSVTDVALMRFQDEMIGRVERRSAASELGTIAAGGPSLDDGSVLDILVLYSDVTRAAAGGTSAIRAEIQLAVDVANDAYAASGIGTRMRLVHMDEVTYDEVTGWDGFEDHLVRLWDPDDGYFDQAHALRDLYGADLISLIVEDSSSGTIGASTCGIAPVMQEMSPDFESLALSAVNRECSADNWTLAHEVGHNQGCAHNRENASVEGLYTYSYGHWFTGDTRGWRSIMAYDSGGAWERVGHFSNPGVSYDGAATGVPIGTTGEAHNASTINSTRRTVARFRTTRYWVDFDWAGTESGLFDTPYNSLPEGLDAVPEGGMVVVKSGSYNANILLTKPLRINSWSGSTIIGAVSP